MKRNSKLVAVLVAGAMVAGLAAGCGSSAKSGSASSAVSAVSSAESSGELQDGVYSAKFTSDSSMFHVNEACNGLGKLTVKDGKMVIHIALASENIVNLFEGTAEDAQKEGAELIQPTVDTINYSDGTTEEVYGFDVPVPAIGEISRLSAQRASGTTTRSACLILSSAERFRDLPDPARIPL